MTPELAERLRCSRRAPATTNPDRGAAILVVPGWLPGMPCPPGDPASKPLLGPCGGGASQGPLRAGLRGPRHLSAEASASCGRNWPGPDVCPDSQGPAPGTNPQVGKSPTGAGTPGRPQSSVSRPRADSRLGVTGEPPTSPQAKPARPQAGRGVTGGESPSSWQATPTRPQAGGGSQESPSRRAARPHFCSSSGCW